MDIGFFLAMLYKPAKLKTPEFISRWWLSVQLGLIRLLSHSVLDWFLHTASIQSSQGQLRQLHRLSNGRSLSCGRHAILLSKVASHRYHSSLIHGPLQLRDYSYS